MKKEEKLAVFLQEECPKGVQLFNNSSVVGDYTETVYEKDGITVDYCPRWGYLEIFGLTEKEFDKLLSKLKDDK